MAEYKLSLLAEQDLLSIFTFSIRTWGDLQAKTYAQEIDAGLSNLAQHLKLGRPRGELYPKAFSFPIERHIAYYHHCESGIEIARVLHQKMDPIKHLIDFIKTE